MSAYLRLTIECQSFTVTVKGSIVIFIIKFGITHFSDDTVNLYLLCKPIVIVVAEGNGLGLLILRISIYAKCSGGFI